MDPVNHLFANIGVSDTTGADSSPSDWFIEIQRKALLAKSDFLSGP